MGFSPSTQSSLLGCEEFKHKLRQSLVQGMYIVITDSLNQVFLCKGLGEMTCFRIDGSPPRPHEIISDGLRDKIYSALQTWHNSIQIDGELLIEKVESSYSNWKWKPRELQRIQGLLKEIIQR